MWNTRSHGIRTSSKYAIPSSSSPRLASGLSNGSAPGSASDGLTTCVVGDGALLGPEDARDGGSLLAEQRRRRERGVEGIDLEDDVVLGRLGEPGSQHGRTDGLEQRRDAGARVGEQPGMAIKLLAEGGEVGQRAGEGKGDAE